MLQLLLQLRPSSGQHNGVTLLATISKLQEDPKIVSYCHAELFKRDLKSHFGVYGYAIKGARTEGSLHAPIYRRMTLPRARSPKLGHVILLRAYLPT